MVASSTTAPPDAADAEHGCCAAASTLATSRSRLARISASWFRSGLGMKSTAPSSRACKVTSAPSCVKALTITTGARARPGAPAAPPDPRPPASRRPA